VSAAYGTLSVTESNLAEFVGGTTYNVVIDEDGKITIASEPAPSEVDPGDGPGDTIARADEVATPDDSTTQLAEGSVPHATE